MSAKNTFTKNKWKPACLSVLLLAGAASGGQWMLGESGALVHSDSEWEISVKVTGNDLLVTGIHTVPETPSPLPLDDAIEGGFRIVGIGKGVFRNKDTLTQVTIPEGVVSIDDDAFCGCDVLTDVSIPNSVTNIGISAFSNCKNLADVKIGNGVASITAYAFAECANMTNVTFASGVTHIDSGAFKDCSALMRLKLPDTVTYIASRAFSGCSGLTELKLPEIMANIEWCAFEYCNSLTGVAIPVTMTNLTTQSVFYNCANLAEIMIPAGVTDINTYMFRSCTNLANIIVSPENTAYRSVDGVLFRNDDASVLLCPRRRRGAFAIPDGTRRIEHGAFAECVGLTDVTIPDSMEEIGGAFGECVGLTSVTIPASVKKIADSAFYACVGLTNIAVSTENPSYRSVDGTLFSKDGARLIQFPQGKKGAYAVPDGVKRISHGAFYKCDYLTGVTLPSSVVNIEKPYFPSFKCMLGPDAPEEEMLQEDEEITDFAIFGRNALQYCFNLTNITVSAENLVYGSVNGMLLTKDGSRLITYPQGANGVSVIPDSVTRIAAGAFLDCRGLTEVFIPDSVTRIDNEAFAGCGNLMKIKIPDSVTHIGDGAFSSCKSLSEVTIPDRVTRIENGTFEFCTNLTAMTIGDNVTYIGQKAFSGSGLTSITIPDSVTNIGWHAFFRCDNLTNVVVGSGVTGIGEHAFAWCDNLETVFFKGTCPKLANIEDIGPMISYGFSDSNLDFHVSKNPTLFIRESRIADWEPHLDSGSFASGDAMWLKRPVRIWKE